MIDVKEVEYNEVDCSCNSEAVCPYCGHGNEIILENESEGEAEEIECGNCEKTFMYTLRISVDYDTQPVENYYLKERQRLQNRIERYEIDDEPFTWQKELVLQLKHDLVQFDKWMERLIEN